MPRTITITIHEPYLKVLENWASVSRTLNTAQEACDNLGSSDTRDAEKFAFCSKELETLIPALDHLHMQARSALWQSDEEEKPKLWEES